MKIRLARLALMAAFGLAFIFNVSCGEHGWETNFLANGGDGDGDGVEPLLQTKWKQSSPYNDLFPIVNGERKVTDCGTTAMVQIMKFHRYPARGNGESSVVGPGNISVPLTNFDVAYDWNNMLNTYTNANPGTEQQRNAVATLMYHFGLARGISGRDKALVENFGYDKSYQSLVRAYYSDAEWEAIIRRQLDLGLPVWYYGEKFSGDSVSSTHGFVVDGYDNTGKFHINWGWAGSYDGWFFLNDMGYNYNQKMEINIKPNAGSNGSNEMALMSFTTSKATASQNELFTVTAKIRSSSFFPGGQAGVALVDNSGNIAAIAGIINNYNAMKPGNARTSTINCTVPTTVNAGQYNLRFVTKMDGEAAWKIAEHSLPDVPKAIPFTLTAESGAAGGGYGLTLTEFTVNKTTASQNGLFVVQPKLKNTNTAAFSAGQIGVALVDNDGFIAAIVGVNNFAALNANATRASTLNSFAPESVKPGQYKLRIVVRPADGDWKVASLALQNIPTAIDFTITEERGATGGGYGLSITNFVSSKTSASQNELFTLASTFKNLGSEAFPGGQVGAALVDGNGNIAAVLGINNFTTLNVNSSRASTMNNFVPESVRAGQYKLRAVVRPTGGEWRVATLAPDTISTAIDFTVMAESGTPGGGYGLSLTNFASSKTSVSQNELFSVTSSFKNLNSEAFPGGQVGAALVDGNGNIAAVVGMINFSTLNVNSSRSSTINSFVPENVRAGQYKLRIVARPEGGEWRVATLASPNITASIDFTVTAETGAAGGGYGLALTNFTSNKTSVSQNELFVVTSAFRNVVLDTFPAGQAGVALVDGNGNIATVVGIVNFAALRSGSSRNVTFNGSVPENVQAGQYKLRAVVRPAGGTWRVATLALPADVPTSINITLTAEIGAAGGGYGLALTNLITTAGASVSQNEFFTVTSALKNLGSEAFSGGQTGVAVVDNNGSIAAVVGMVNFAALNVNSSRTSTFNCYVPESVRAGQYKLRIVVRPTDGTWRVATMASPADVSTAININVTAEAGAPGGGYGLALTNFSTTAGASVSQNEFFTVTSALKNLGTEAFSGGQAGVAVVDGSGNIAAVVGMVNFAALNVNSSRTSTINCYVPESVRAGQYKLRIVVRPTDGTWRVATLASPVDVSTAININLTAEAGAPGGGHGLALTSFSTTAGASVSQNRVFTTTSGFKNVVLNAFPGGQAGTALVDGSGNITAVIGIVNFAALNSGSSRTSTINCYVPESVRPGQYKLRAVVKPTDGTWRVATMASPADVSTAINITVTQAEADVAGDGYGLSFEEFSSDKTSALYNENFTVSVKIKNVAPDASPAGQLGVALLNSSGNIVEVIRVISYAALNSGSTRTSSLTNTSVPTTVAAGQYRLRIVARPTDGEWKVIKLTINGVPTSINFTVSSDSRILLQARWNQGSPYNDLFPLVNGVRKVTDCVTTASVQIMKFHRYPVRGKGESTAVGPTSSTYPTVTVPLTSLNVAYDWDNMLNQYTTANPGNERQRNAVATLMYHFGLARGIDDNLARIFTENFGYDKSFQAHLREYYSNAEWEALIRQQLELKLPVLYHGKSVANADDYSTESSHGFVVDGYDNAGKFHINTGWGASQYDGWYSLNDINLGEGRRYNYGNKIWINIKPDAGSVGSNVMGLNKFTASKASVSQGEGFTVSYEARSAGYFAGQAGVAVVNNSGNIVEVIGTANYNAVNPGGTRASTINCSVPTTVSAGQYKLRFVTKMNGETAWKIATQSLPNIPSSIDFKVL